MKSAIRAMSALLMVALLALVVATAVADAGKTLSTTRVMTTLDLMRVAPAHAERGTTAEMTTTTEPGAGFISSVSVD